MAPTYAVPGLFLISSPALSGKMSTFIDEKQRVLISWAFAESFACLEIRMQSSLPLSSSAFY